MLKQTIFLLLSCWILGSVFAFQPTPILQFLYPDRYKGFQTPGRHIGDDIVGFVPSQNTTKIPHKYLKITLETSHVEKILVDTIASCYVKGSGHDPSYYYAAAATYLYYCAANNTLLVLGQDYTIRDAIPISTSQRFEDVILGHNEQGYVYILGLPNLLYLPAQKPTELILVDLKTKAVENHVVFNKGSDSQIFVAGYAFDAGSGISYVLTRGLEGAQTSLKISQIVLSGNDYELTPFANMTFPTWDDYGVYHNRFHIVDGYFFTNAYSSFLIFDKNGSLIENKAELSFYGVQKGASKSEILYFPDMAAQVGGSSLYVMIKSDGLAYSLQNGVMTSRILENQPSAIVLGGLDKGDLFFGNGLGNFRIKDAKTNTTIYTSIPFNYYNKIMLSTSHYLIFSDSQLFVFDRKKPGQLLKIIPGFGIPYLDKATNQLVGFSGKYSCSITYTDLETLEVRYGPSLSSQQACQSVLVYTNITDPARPFLVGRYVDRDHYFISPSNYGAVLWRSGDIYKADGMVIPGDNDESFTYVWSPYSNATEFHVDFYKYDKMARSFTIRDSFTLTIVQRDSQTTYFNIGSDKVAISIGQDFIVIDFVLRNYKIYEAPAPYHMKESVGVISDKNKTPYAILSENYENFNLPSAAPQLFDSTSLTTVPGAIPNITKVGQVINSCTYSLMDKYDYDFAVVRLLDSCQSSPQTEKISI